MKFTRRHTIGLLGAAIVPTGFPPVQARVKRSYDLVPKLVADGIWMIEGTTEYFTDENGGAIVNCALVETSVGVVVIDTGPSLRYGEALRKVVGEVGGKGIAASINTHHHPDHFFGNQVFTDKPIYALAETAALARTEGDGLSDNMYRLLGDWMRGTEVVPPTTLLDSSVLEIGDRVFEVIPLKGHTGADLAVLDKKTGTLVAGDLAFLDRAPTTPHANLAEWRNSIEHLQSIAFTGILPGHGPFDRENRSLSQTLDYLAWLEVALSSAANRGLGMVETMDTPIPARFSAMGAMPSEFHRSISHLFGDIEREVMPLVNARQSAN